MTYIEPALPLLLFLGFAGLVRAWRHSVKGKRPWFLTVSLAGILLLSLNSGAWILSRPLEMQYSENPLPQENAQAIVVLAGAVDPPLPNRPYALAGEDTRIRLERAVWLFRHWSPLPILASGGGVNGKWYAETMRHILESEGIPPDLIWIESNSRSTHENALFGSELLRQHGVSRIALVVEASSMIRAAACFRKQGIAVVPAPARYNRMSGDYHDWIPGWRPLASNGETFHEAGGLVWYWLRGWI